MTFGATDASVTDVNLQFIGADQVLQVAARGGSAHANVLPYQLCA
jgi:hypothetical protein